MSVNFRWGRFASWCRKNGLFCAIVSWIFLAIIAYTLLSAIWGDGHGWNRVLTGWHIGTTHDPLDRIKVTLTALGGVGAVGYLVIKYRERSALERGEADEKLVRAVQQLGDPSPQVRIAGVYALADVADTYEGPYHQRVVDILCGYLRTDRLLKDANGDTRYATNDDGTPDYDHPLNADSAVESTILSVLTSHLRASHSTTQGPWSDCNIDLHRTILTEEVDLSGTIINKITCKATIFKNQCTFSGAKLKQEADFSDAVFHKFTWLDGVNFPDSTKFWGTSFEMTAVFDSSTFGGEVVFGGCNFRKGAHFSEVKFVRNCGFEDTKFALSCHFERATFVKEARFYGVKFEGFTYFDKVTFSNNVNFGGVKFGGVCFFNGATFRGTSHISSTSFCDDAIFDGVNFEREAHFANTSFKKNVKLEFVRFRNGYSLYNVRFNIDLRGSNGVSFPINWLLENNGLPAGGSWFDFSPKELGHSTNQHCERAPDEERQPDEVPPTDGLPQDKDGEEDGHEHAQLVDGDHHAGGAVLERSVVAKPGGTGRSPGGQDEAELPTRNTTDLPELPGDGHHRPGHHQDHPGTDRGTEVGLHPRDAGLTEDRGERGEEG